jgi:hypothetical protein
VISQLISMIRRQIGILASHTIPVPC